jgi:hypothetical protein
MIVDRRVERGVELPIEEIPAYGISKGDMAALGISRDISDTDIDDDPRGLSHSD